MTKSSNTQVKLTKLQTFLVAKELHLMERIDFIKVLSWMANPMASAGSFAKQKIMEMRLSIGYSLVNGEMVMFMEK